METTSDKVAMKDLYFLNSLPNDKILDWSKMKAFADDNINVKEKFKFGLGRVENIVGKGENAGNRHFLLFSQCFPKPTVSLSLKSGLCGKEFIPLLGDAKFRDFCGQCKSISQ